MKFIMITTWWGHWDNIRGDSTYYSTTMVPSKIKKEEILKLQNVETLFIKIPSDKDFITGCWTGKTTNFREEMQSGKPIIRFDVIIGLRASFPTQYQDLKSGWYCEDWQSSPAVVEDKSFDPPFFDILNTTTDHKHFETHAYRLLKVLGLHTLYKFPMQDQSGKSDGFFVFKSLAVIFDMTLRKDFEQAKKVQMENYCGQLKNGMIEIIKGGKKREFNVGSNARQVWIITNGSSREIRTIDGITIKEVPIKNIMELYRKRIQDDLDEADFEKKLLAL
ncbi:MAG: hypothetical protein HZA49_06665 [Planctomycetes bacterium]|nr:hypothetical protein [Planctomycetota bacterium]